MWRVTFLGQQNDCPQSLEWVVPVSAFQARAGPPAGTVHHTHTPTPHPHLGTQNKGFSVASTFPLGTLISALPYLGWRIVLREFPGKGTVVVTEA